MAELAIGAVLAGYRIEGIAGRGGMGVVYRATQLGLDRQVAVKLIAPELARDESFRDRFKRESRTAAQIEHAHVIPVHEAGEADGELFIAMRLVDGIDLRELIRREGRIDPHRAARLLAQTASALDAAHARGLVHRDIKPGNVLIANEGGGDHAYLTDFGLSKRLDSESGVTRTGVFVGTVDYIAPEQIQGQPLDARSDVYSLGCLLYHALTGRVPFVRDSDVAKIFAHMSEPPPPVTEAIADLPPDLDAVVRRAMAKDPDDRYPSAGDLGRAALAAVEGRQVEEAERSVATGDAAPVTHTMTEVDAPAAARVRGRGLVVVGALCAAVAAVAIVLLVAGAFSGDEGDDAGQSAFAEDAALVTPIAVGSPAGLALGDGSLWVTNYKSNTVTRIDLESAEAAKPIAVREGPTSVVVGGGVAWVLNGGEGTISKVDLARGEVVGNQIDIPSASEGDSMALGEGKLWVVTPEDGRVLPIDVASGKAGAAIDPGDGTAGEIAFGEGAVWVIGDHGNVTRVDPKTGKAAEPVKVGTRIPEDSSWRGHIAAGEGAVWVSGLDDETVVRLDPRSGQVTKTIHFGDPGIEGDIAVGDGAVWVVGGYGELIRIDPRTAAVVPGSLPGGTAGTNDITVGDGAIWVAGDIERNTVTRVEP